MGMLDWLQRRHSFSVNLYGTFRADTAVQNCLIERSIYLPGLGLLFVAAIFVLSVAAGRPQLPTQPGFTVLTGVCLRPSSRDTAGAPGGVLEETSGTRQETWNVAMVTAFPFVFTIPRT